MQDLIARLRMKPGLSIVDEEQSWEFRIPKPDDLVFEITVPREVLEWYVTARRASTNQEIWSDWMDYYGRTQAALKSEMERDIERFTGRLLASHIRVVTFRKVPVSRQRLEWRTDEDWAELCL